MREAHLLDLEDLPTTEAAAILIGEKYLEERHPTSTLPLEVRYMDPAGEVQTIEYVRGRGRDASGTHHN